MTALVLTCVFILFAARKLVPALRSPHGFALLLWVLVVAHRALIPRVDPLGVGRLQWGPVVIAEVSLTVSIFVSCLALFVARSRSNRIRGAPITVRLVFLYAAMAALSLTRTPAPAYAGFWLLRLLSAVFLLAVYFDSVDDSGVARFAGCTCIALIPYMLFPWIELLLGEKLEEHRVPGFYVHEISVSTIGYAVSILCLFFWLERRRSIGWAVVGLLGFSSAYLAGGKGPAAAMSIVLLAVFAANRRKILSGRGMSATLVACAVLSLFVLSTDIGLLAHLKQYSGSDYGSLRSRVDLWGVAIPMWSKAPMRGYGFATALAISLPHGEWTASHAHNSFLQSLLEVGLLGSLPLFSAIGVVLLRTLRLGVRAFQLTPLAPILAAWCLLLLCSVTNVVFGPPFQPEAYLFLAFLVCADALTQRAHA